MKDNLTDKRDNRIIPVTNDVSWIGVLDYDIVTFDIVMTTEFGTTYNSYFINADKKTIIEGVKTKFSDVHVAKLRTLTDPSRIEYIVLDHTEPDHSGNVSALLDLAPDATVVGTGNAIKYLGDMINRPFKSLVVKDGDKLDLGNKTLSFISAPNLHWPDTMFTWLEEDKLLFTCDFFGAHYCTEEMITDFSDDYLRAFRYYFDVILKPYSRFGAKALEKIEELAINAICPGHGPMHLESADEVISMTSKLINNYLNLTSIRNTKRVLITYVSAYGYTKTMADQIAEGVREVPDMNPVVMDIEMLPIGDMESEVVLADAILVGSPTINQNTLLPVYKLFSVINPLRDRAKIAGAFGSYGWSGEAPGIILESLRTLKLRIFEEKAVHKFYPGGSKSDLLREYGRRFAEFLVAECRKE